jgi:hypothetical protein
MYAVIRGGRMACLRWRDIEEGDMGGKHVRVVPVTGDETYERIWEQVRHGAVLSVEFSRAGDQRMLAVTTVMDSHGVTVDSTYVEL